jgi:alcohol dehydrogenase class IV
VTKNAVVKSSAHGVKASIRSPLMMPTVAIVDPLLTVSKPPHVTAHTGLDALCQCIEPFVSNKANPFTDGLAKEVRGRVLGVWEDLTSLSALTLALAFSRTGSG